MRHYACKQYDYMVCGQNINIKNIKQEYYFSVVLIKSGQSKNNSKLKCPTTDVENVKDSLNRVYKITVKHI